MQFTKRMVHFYFFSSKHGQIIFLLNPEFISHLVKSDIKYYLKKSQTLPTRSHREENSYSLNRLLCFDIFMLGTLLNYCVFRSFQLNHEYQNCGESEKSPTNKTNILKPMDYVIRVKKSRIILVRKKKTENQ